MELRKNQTPFPDSISYRGGKVVLDKEINETHAAVFACKYNTDVGLRI